MAVLDNWTFDWDTALTSQFNPGDIWPGYTCVAPIVQTHTIAQTFAPVSGVTFGKRFTSQTNVGHITSFADGYHPGDCSRLRVQLVNHLFGQSETEASEGWYAWSIKWPTSPGAISTWEGLGLAVSGDHVTHPGYGMFGFRSPNNGQYALQIKVGHCPSPIGSGTTDTFGTNGIGDWKPIGPTSGVSTTNKNGYDQTPILLGPGGVAPLTLNVWHDFLMHVLWKSTTDGELELWHREEGQTGSSPLFGFTKMYTNKTADSALITVAPHPTMQWNLKYGAPGQGGSPAADLDFQCYRSAPGPQFDIYHAGIRRRGSFSAAMSEFVNTGGAAPAGLPDPAPGYTRFGFTAAPAVTACGIDGKRVILRDLGTDVYTADGLGYIYVAGPSSGGSQPHRMIVQDNDGSAGLPGTTLGTSAQIVAAQGQAEGWVPCDFSAAPITGITGPTYFGDHSGGPGQGSIGFQSVSGQGWFKSDTYSDGTATPFGTTPTNINLEISCVLDLKLVTDVTAPTLVSAGVRTQSPTIIDFIFSESLSGAAPASSAFTIKIQGSPVTINSPVVLSGAVASLTMAAPITGGDTVLGSYTPPGSNKLQDAAGNLVLAFTDQSVSNPPLPSPGSGARVIGGTRTATARTVGGTPRRAGEGGGAG